MKLAGKKDMVIIGAALAVCLAAALLFAGSGGNEVRIYVGVPRKTFSAIESPGISASS